MRNLIVVSATVLLVSAVGCGFQDSAQEDGDVTKKACEQVQQCLDRCSESSDVCVEQCAEPEGWDEARVRTCRDSDVQTRQQGLSERACSQVSRCLDACKKPYETCVAICAQPEGWSEAQVRVCDDTRTTSQGLSNTCDQFEECLDTCPDSRDVCIQACAEPLGLDTAEANACLE